MNDLPDVTIPVNDLKRYASETASELSTLAARVLRSGHYVLGPCVQEFERAFADYCGVRHSIGVANGTDALELSLRAIGVRPADKVLVAANAAMYGTTSVLAIGAEPLFSDVDERTGLLTRETIERCLGTSAAKPRAIIVTHLYGRLALIEDIVDLARSLEIAVIEDCAQAHGATRDGRKAGSFGDVAAFSFYPTKNLGAIGDGGALACNDDAVAARARQLRQYGWTSKYENTILGGRNSRLDEIQAAFLCHLLIDLDRRNGRRMSIAARYSREITHPGIEVPVLAGTEFVAHLFVVKCERRDELATHLRMSGIATDIHYPVPDHRQQVHGGRFSDVSLPVTEHLCSQVLTLPCFPELREDEVAQVILACNNWNSELSRS